MKTDSILYWVIYFVVTILVAWIALSLILLWFRPAFYNDDGSVNWWVTLWVSALIILFAWIIMIILQLLIKLFTGPVCKPACKPVNECAPQPECYVPKQECKVPCPEPVKLECNTGCPPDRRGWY